MSPGTAGFRSDLRLLAARSPDPGGAPRQVGGAETGASTGRRRAWEALGTGSKSAAPRFVRFPGRDETREEEEAMSGGLEEGPREGPSSEIGRGAEGLFAVSCGEWFVYHGTCTDKETN